MMAEVDFSVCCDDQDSGIEEEFEYRLGGMTTGLHLAAIHDSPEIASLLIENGCPINALDEEVNSIMLPAQLDSVSVMFPSLSFQNGETALHIAIRRTSLDVADVLKRTPGGEELERIKNKVGSLALVCYTQATAHTISTGSIL